MESGFYPNSTVFAIVSWQIRESLLFVLFVQARLCCILELIIENREVVCERHTWSLDFI